MSRSDSVIVGVTLLAVLPVVLVVEGPASRRGHYDGRFWRKTLADKLDHIVGDEAGWRRIGLSWVPTLGLTLAGTMAFSYLLADVGVAVWAWLAQGFYTLGAFAWFVGVLVQTAVVGAAARERAATGRTPEWLAGFWTLGWWSELTFVITANVAGVLWSIGMLRSDYPSDITGWVTLAMAALILVSAAAFRNVFPHLGLVVPVIIGLGLVLS